MIYLGGYHNSVRRKLLELLYQDFPKAEYLHFGDIDVGGFEIYRDLLQKKREYLLKPITWVSKNWRNMKPIPRN